MMDMSSIKVKELSESVESLDKDFLEKVAKHQTDRRLSVPRMGTDLTFRQQQRFQETADDEDEDEESVGSSSDEGGAVGGVGPDVEGGKLTESIIRVEDCGDDDSSEHLPQSRTDQQAYLERMYQAGIERQRQEADKDYDSEEETEKARQDTELLLKIMETEKEKKQRRGSWKSIWDEDDPEEDSKINEDIESDPVKRLLWAAENNEVQTARELLEEKSELIGVKDEDGYSPLHRAAYNGHAAMVEFLLEKGANLGAPTNDGWQPLHCAARWNNPHIASLLIQAGCDVNAATNGGQTPLHLAASNPESEEVLSMLLMSRYIDTTMKNAADETAFDIARRAGRLAYLFEMRDTHLLPSTS